MEIHQPSLNPQNTSTGKKVLCFTNDSWESALSQVRLRGPLQAAGFCVIPGNEREQCLVDNLDGVDFVVIQRDFPQFIDLFLFVLKETRKRQIPLVYEIDDLLFYLPENHPLQKDGNYSKNFIPMLIAISRADLVTVSTEPLGHYLKQFNSNVQILSNYLNDALWEFQPVKEKTQNDFPVVIGYIGGSTHQSDISMIANALIRIKSQFEKKVSFKFFGAEPPQALTSRINIDWQPIIADYDDYSKAFRHQNIDILIAPLEDNLFNQSKSWLKYLEYSTLGVPGVFSMGKPYDDIVDHEQTGFLASSEDDWVRSLAVLIETPELRVRIAENAQELVKKNFLLSDHAFEWADAYGKIGDVSAKYQASSSAPLAAQEELLKQFHTQKFIDNQKSLEITQDLPSVDEKMPVSISEAKHLIIWKIQKLIKKIFHKGH